MSYGFSNKSTCASDQSKLLVRLRPSEDKNCGTLLINVI